MTAQSLDTLLRLAAFERVRSLSEIHDHLTANELKPGFIYAGQRIPLINPQRVIALINDPPVVRRILEHLGFWQPQAMERSPPVPSLTTPSPTSPEAAPKQGGRSRRVPAQLPQCAQRA